MASFQPPEEEELQIENKYLKEKKIGEGTYAKVYKGKLYISRLKLKQASCANIFI